VAWRRLAKWSLIVFSSLLLLLLVALVSVHFALKSGELTQQAVPKLAPYLKPLGIELQQLESARIDSLRSVQLRNVKLVWRDSDLGEVQFTAARFDASYDLPALLSNQLHINQVLLEDARISARLRPSVDTQPAVSEEPANLEQLSELLRLPPMPILAKAININNVELDVLIEFEQEATKQSLSYKGLLQQITMEVQWQENHLKGDLLTALGQDGKSALLVSLTQQDQTLELEAAPAIRTQATWELNHDGVRWNLKNAAIEDQLEVPPVALYQRQLQRVNEERTPVGSVAAVQVDMTSRVNSIADKIGNKDPKKNPAGDLTSIFPVKVSSRLSTAVKDLKMEGIRFQDAQISGQADQELNFKLDGEVDPLSLVFKDFQIQVNQSLAIAGLDAKIGGQHAVINDLSLQVDTQANTQPDAGGDVKTTLPLKFTTDIKGQAQHIELHQASSSQGEQALEAQLSPQFQLSASGQLQPFENFLQALTADFEQQLTLQDVAFRVGNGDSKQQYRIGRQQLSSTGSYKDETLSMDSELNLERVAVSKNLKRFSMNNHIHSTSDVHLRRSNVSVQSSLDKQPILALDMNVDNQPQRLNVQNTLQVDLPKGLHAYHPALEDLFLLGRSRINGTTKVQLNHGADSVLTADFTTANQWPITLDGEWRLTQLSPPKADNGVIFAKPATVNFKIKTDEQYQTAIHAEVPGVLVSPLQKPVPLRADLQSRFTWPLTITTASGKIEVHGEKALQFDMNMNDQPRHARIDSRTSINIDPQWQRYLAELKELGATGRLASDWHLLADVKHPYRSITLWDPASPEKVKASISLTTELKQLSSDPKTQIRLPKPVKMTQQLDWSKKAVSWKSQFSAAAMEWAKQAKVQDFSGNLSLHASPGDSPTKASIALHLDKAKLLLMNSASDENSNENPVAIGHVVTPLDLQLSGTMGKEQIHLKDINLNMADDLVTLASTGYTSLDGQRAQLESSLNVTLRPDLMTQPAVSGNGSFSIPRLLTIKEGEKITVDGEMQFNDLETAVDDFQITGLNGRLMLNEELLVTQNQRIKFRYLVQADPFQRVDFTRLQPYLDNPSLRIQNITIGDKLFGPVLANISLKQNLLRLPRIDMDLFGGHLSGQFYFDANPGEWKIALLGRLSQLDPRQLLPDHAPTKDSELSPMSARVAMEFGLNQRLLEGRIDVTQISREQLLQLMDVIDPEHQDEQLAQVRTALRLAYPKWVSLDMQQGLMDMAVDISTLPKPIKVYGLPLTPLIQHFAGDTLDELGSLPLE
jgi:hypothetical protein